MQEIDNISFTKKSMALNFIANEILRVEIDLNSRLIVTATTFISNMILATFFTAVTLVSTGYTIWIPIILFGAITLGFSGLIIINKLLRRQIKHYMEEHRKRYFEFLKNIEKISLQEILGKQ